MNPDTLHSTAEPSKPAVRQHTVHPLLTTRTRRRVGRQLCQIHTAHSPYVLLLLLLPPSPYSFDEEILIR